MKNGINIYEISGKNRNFAMKSSYMLRYLQHMVQLLLSPTRGWEDVASHPIEGGEAFRRGLLPLMVISALSVVFRAVYQFHSSVATLIPAAVISFLQYFLTYLIAQVALSAYLPRISAGGKTDEQRLQLFLCFTVGMMAVIGIIGNLLPMTLTLIEFLPIYVAVVMFRAHGYLGIRSDVVGTYVGSTVLSVIVPVYLFGFILNKFIQ